MIIIIIIIIIGGTTLTADEIASVTADINRAASQLGEDFAMQVQVRDQFLPPGKNYEFRAKLTSWLGGVAESNSILVSKSALEYYYYYYYYY
jgi:hypothetical protein